MVLSASDGVEGLEALGRERVDLSLVDLMMPNVNGFEFISSARAMTDVPIIVVFARGNPADKALGLDLGADGYITKPFDPSEVLAYVRAVLRRYRNGLSASLRSEDEPSTSPGILSCGDLELDREALVLRKRGRVVPLTVSEIKIVMRLMSAPGRIFTKAQLYEAASGISTEASSESVMVHISNIRAKIEDDPAKPAYIVTVRGLGYKLVQSFREPLTCRLAWAEYLAWLSRRTSGSCSSRRARLSSGSAGT